MEIYMLRISYGAKDPLFCEVPTKFCVEQSPRTSVRGWTKSCFRISSRGKDWDRSVLAQRNHVYIESRVIGWGVLELTLAGAHLGLFQP